MPRKRLPASVCLALCPVLAAHAQDGDERERGLAGAASLGYLATSGNTESTNANAGLSLTYTRVDWAHEFDLSAVGASTEDRTTAEAYQLEYEGRRRYGRHHYLFTALDWKRDRFSGYAEQMSQTVGYGRRLLDGGAHTLDGGIGFGVRQAELRDGTDEEDEIARGTIDYSWSMSDTTELEHSLVVESGSTNTMTESRAALRARLIGDVALVLSYRLKYNTDVPAGAEASDRFSSISLEYAF